MTSSAAAVARTDGPSARAERPIVVGIDGSPGSVAALRWAASEARAHGRPLTAVVAYDVPAYYGYPPVSYTHLRAHETPEHLVCRPLLDNKTKEDYDFEHGMNPALVHKPATVSYTHL